MSSPPPTSPPPMVWPPAPSGNVVPFPLPWGQTGCCPPGGMSSLMQCYCDVQAATAFICSVMVQCVNNNPAVVEAIIAAIEKSGSSLPLIGVTNGVAAQPGQVGEYIQLTQTVSFPASPNTQTITMGILQPGDWDCWLWVDDISVNVDNVGIVLLPQPAGFSSDLHAGIFSLSPVGTTLASNAGEALISVPTLVPVQVSSSSSTAGTLQLFFAARRQR